MLNLVDITEVSENEAKEAKKRGQIVAVATGADGVKRYGISGITVAAFVNSGTEAEKAHWIAMGAMQPASAMIRLAITPLDPEKEQARADKKMLELLRAKLSSEELARLVAKVTGK